jgi:FkbM family methyltransferase
VRPFSVLDYVVSECITQEPRFYFVQIGAHDGARNDPIYHLVLKYKLHGLLVEPLPDFFQELQKNYHHQPQLTFANCAISTRDGFMSIFRFKRNAPVPAEFFHGLARTDRVYIVKRAKQNGLECYVEEVKVPCLTFSTLINEHSITHVTLLQIDTEGHDYEVLKSVMASHIRPEFINYEWSEITARERYLCKQMLIDNGYKFIDVGADVLCKRESAITK